jgi:arylsulfatase A-like enzyme
LGCDIYAFGYQPVEITKNGKESRQGPKRNSLFIFIVRPWILVAVCAICSGGSLLSIHCRRAAEEKNLLLITLDTQRADHLSCYDPGHAQTPYLDALAEEGTLFENCYSLIPITLPAHAAMFYSQQPNELSIYNNGETFKEREKAIAVAEILKGRGYATAAFVSMGVLQAEYGLHQGFAEYTGNFPQRGRYYATAEEINEQVFPWLDRNLDKTFFLWVHYSDPHSPYHPPDSGPNITIQLNGKKLDQYYLNETLYELEIDLAPGDNWLHVRIDNPYRNRPKQRYARFRHLEVVAQEGRESLVLERKEGWFGSSDKDIDSCARDATLRIANPKGLKKARLKFRGSLALGHRGARELYKKEVEYMDRQIGILVDRLKQLGLYPKTHILVVGDHGEGLGEYRKRNQRLHFGHIQYLYDIYLRVPLLIRPAHARSRGRRIKAPVSLLDIAPSLLVLAGLRPPQFYAGNDLFSSEYPGTQEIFQATYRPEANRDQFAILSYPLHFIITPKDNLYELYDLSSDPQEKSNIYAKQSQKASIRILKRRLDEAARDILKNRTVPKKDKHTEEMLRALGYIK